MLVKADPHQQRMQSSSRWAFFSFQFHLTNPRSPTHHHLPISSKQGMYARPLVRTFIPMKGMYEHPIYLYRHVYERTRQHILRSRDLCSSIHKMKKMNSPYFLHRLFNFVYDPQLIPLSSHPPTFNSITFGPWAKSKWFRADIAVGFNLNKEKLSNVNKFEKT